MSKKIKIWSVVFFCALLLVLLKVFFDQKFDSIEDIQNYMKGFGIAAPLILLVF